MKNNGIMKNALWGVIEELTLLVCGLIMPRIIIKYYGSFYNGLVSSISQFMAFSVILRAGVGGVTRAALYRPLLYHDTEQINAIMKATILFMKRIGTIIFFMVVLLAMIYPILIYDQTNDFIFVMMLVLIIGGGTFIESYVGIPYLIILQADQNIWVVSIIRVILYVVSTTISVALISYGSSILVVKLVSTVIFMLLPISMYLFVRKKYKLDLDCDPDYTAINHRWDAFWQQIAVLVMDNTDIILITVFLTLQEVSVYSLYIMVITVVKRLINAIMNGIEAFLGRIIVSEEKEKLYRDFSILETLTFSICIIAFSCAYYLHVDFISLYMRGVSDANYYRPVLSAVLVFYGFVSCLRLPYQLLAQASGKYRETRNAAILEPVINIIVSIALVNQYGVIGVAIGTLVAVIYRLIQYSLFVSKSILQRKNGCFLMHIVVTMIDALLIHFFISRVVSFEVVNVPTFIMKFCIIFVISLLIVAALISIPTILLKRKHILK